MKPSPAASVRNYAIVTGAYWADTLADGAIRTLILFYFFERGYTPLQVATLFLFYEIFGILTNLYGGYLGARLGLKATLFLGLVIQLAALAMLGVASPAWLTVPYVMASQALSGVAKDLTKMSSKSAVKLVAGASESRLYRWVALLTGSKNALKGIGFFLGALLLSTVGFQRAVMVLIGLVFGGLVLATIFLRGSLGVADKAAKFVHMFSHNRAVNLLAAARLFLFGARDVWFTVGLPVFLASGLGWKFWQAGAFMALWIIGYGAVQAASPAIRFSGRRRQPDGRSAMWLAIVLALVPAGIALALQHGFSPAPVVISGLTVFGVIFALNSAVHSYLILSYAEGDKVALKVGFYYMANAGGRLAGTVLSGLLYQLGLRHDPIGGLVWCLWGSVVFVALAAFFSVFLPAGEPESAATR